MGEHPLLLPRDDARRASTPRSRAWRSAPRTRKYLFVYPFVKTRDWYGHPPRSAARSWPSTSRIGREYPNIDTNTSYSFGLDDQEFVVAFETDEPGDFLDLVQRLRTTEASRYTQRDTPTFSCLSMPVARALAALDGEAVLAAGPSR